MTRSAARPSVRSCVFGALLGGSVIASSIAPTSGQNAAVTATWHDGRVIVDGSMTDWSSLARVATGPAVAVQNDASTLYLAVASNDPAVRIQLATGLIVWLDGTAQRRQTFGLRLEGLAPRPIRGTTTDTPANDLSKRLLVPIEEFDLLGPARLQRRLIDDASAIGITLAAGVEEETIVYELRIPLEKTDATPQAIGVKPGATIGIALETPADPKGPRTRNRLDDPTNTNAWLDPWGYGGYFTTPPPPPGGYPRAPKEVEFRPMRLVWMSVRLAAGPATTAP